MIKIHSILQQNKFLKLLLSQQSLFFGVFFKFLAVGFGFYTTYWINNYLTVEDQASYNLITAYTPMILYFLGFGINEIIQKYYTNTNIRLRSLNWRKWKYRNWISIEWNSRIIIIVI